MAANCPSGVSVAGADILAPSLFSRIASKLGIAVGVSVDRAAGSVAARPILQTRWLCDVGNDPGAPAPVEVGVGDAAGLLNYTIFTLTLRVQSDSREAAPDC